MAASAMHEELFDSEKLQVRVIRDWPLLRELRGLDRFKELLSRFDVKPKERLIGRRGHFPDRGTFLCSVYREAMQPILQKKRSP